jgi:hypothetical protein
MLHFWCQNFEVAAIFFFQFFARECSAPDVKVTVCVEELENNRIDVNIDTGDVYEDVFRHFSFYVSWTVLMAASHEELAKFDVALTVHRR